MLIWWKREAKSMWLFYVARMYCCRTVKYLKIGHNGGYSSWKTSLLWLHCHNIYDSRFTLLAPVSGPVSFQTKHVSVSRPSKHMPFTQCWNDVNGGQTLYRHWENLLCMLGWLIFIDGSLSPFGNEMYRPLGHLCAHIG